MSAKSKSELRYRFGEHEPLPEGTRRILCEQLTSAASALADKEMSLEEAVHEARRYVKRTRSLLRLVRFAIPTAYEVENRRLQRVSRSLSEVRDSHALTGTLRSLEKHGGTFPGVEEFLRIREAKASKRITQNNILESSVVQLKEAKKRIRRRSFRKVDLKGVFKSARKSVKRGKKAFAAAKSDPLAEKFHDWRKRAKDLRFQLAVLSECRPDLESYSDSAKRLEQLLGDDHNLAVLSSLLAELGSNKPTQHLQILIGKQQMERRVKAERLGEEIYGGKSRVWKEELIA